MKSQTDINNRVALIKELREWYNAVAVAFEMGDMLLRDAKDVASRSFGLNMTGCMSKKTFVSHLNRLIRDMGEVIGFADDGESIYRVDGQVGRYFLRGIIADQDFADSIFEEAKKVMEDYRVNTVTLYYDGLSLNAEKNSIKVTGWAQVQAIVDNIFDEHSQTQANLITNARLSFNNGMVRPIDPVYPDGQRKTRDQMIMECLQRCESLGYGAVLLDSNFDVMAIFVLGQRPISIEGKVTRRL